MDLGTHGNWRKRNIYSIKPTKICKNSERLQQIKKIRNEGDVITNFAEVKRVIKRCYKQLYDNK
jgi:hypothetical protein